MLIRWFCPPGGLVLDPCAGGSVRGVVAATMGRRYWGMDLRPEQVAANVAQWGAIGTGIGPGAGAAITVSGKQLRQRFQPCVPDYIKSTCKGRCCESSNGGIRVVIHPTETDRITRLGGAVGPDGYLAPDARGLCPFKSDDGLCGIHAEKPLGCRASPFTLAPGGRTLVVRNRYRLLGCYRGDGAVPAYEAHGQSLAAILGAEQAARVAAAAAAGDDAIPATIERGVYTMLVANAERRRANPGDVDLLADPPGQPGIGGDPVWVVGDATVDLAPGRPGPTDADLILTCPPYHDLEQYSDDPRDLSAMGWDGFVAGMRAMVRDSAARLAADRFAAFVIGDVRDGAGNYRSLPGALIDWCAAAGLRLYNQAILITPYGSLAVRVGKQFIAGRKLGLSHQQVLIFVKGSGKAATAACGPVDVSDPGGEWADADDTGAAPGGAIPAGDSLSDADGSDPDPEGASIVGE